MAVRNFYVEADVDGRATSLAGGPRAKDGGMTVRLYQRADGRIERAFTIECREENGVLVRRVYNNDSEKVAEFESAR